MFQWAKQAFIGTVLYGNISVVDIHDEICQEISQFSLPNKLTNFFEGGVYPCAMSAGDGHDL